MNAKERNDEQPSAFHIHLGIQYVIGIFQTAFSLYAAYSFGMIPWYMNVKRPSKIVRSLQKKQKTPVAIIGTGNIGSDLLTKIQRSQWLTCVLFAGKNPDSRGIARARTMGIPVSDASIEAIIKNSRSIDIVFDATSAEFHQIHAPILRKLKKFTLDMTPSKIGTMCVPVVNLKDGLTSQNVSMISCGGQANIPLISAIMRIHPDVQYVEVVSSISSKSAGIGTRNNIDEYTQTTSDAIINLTGVAKAKTIIILNPADPPIYMHNTIYIPVKNPDMERITVEIKKTVALIIQYVPGYSVVLGPLYVNGKLIIMTEVVGLGDFLPAFAGNLDIINCAAVTVAEEYAKMHIYSESKFTGMTRKLKHQRN